MKTEETNRNFRLISFKDRYDQECSLQESSLVDPCIWFGVDNTGPDLENKEGTRMHLTIEMVKTLLPALKHFVKTGELPDYK